jgi:exopolysaccharide biosynthesis protein
MKKMIMCFALVAVTLIGWNSKVHSRTRPLVGGAHFMEVKSEGVTLKMVVIDEAKCEMRVVVNEAREGAKVLAEWGEAPNGIAVCNGGYFDTQKFTPAGLEIVDGKSSGQLVTGNRYEGSLLISASGPRLVWDGESMNHSQAKHLVQCNPWLVNDGVPFPAPQDKASEPEVRRTFVMTDGKGKWAIGISSSVTLSGLAELLAYPSLIQDFTVTRALNLDGGPSTGLWVKGGEEELKLDQPKWAVRNGILIRAKSADSAVKHLDSTKNGNQ